MAQKILTIASGAVNAKLVDPTIEEKREIQRLLAYQVSATMGSNEWDGRSSFYEFMPGTFPAGFVVKVYRHFTALGYQVNIVRAPLPTPLGPVNPVVDTYPEDPRYHYQPKVIGLLERYGQIIAKVATGGGKSRIAKLAYARIKRPTLFLTTRSILMHQMKATFQKDLGIPVATYGDGEWSERRQEMSVGMVQSFAARLKDPDPTHPAAKQAAQRARQLETVELLQTFELLILEEAHEASSDSFFSIARTCRRAFYRLALTATPFMKDSEADNMRLEASSGPIAIEVTEKMLIDSGILARPYFKYIDTGLAGEMGVLEDADGNDAEHKLYRSTPFEKAVEVGIVGNHARNAAILRETKAFIDRGLTVMLLIIRKRHGVRLRNMLNDAGIRCAFIQGEDSQATRLGAIQALKDRKIDVLIGSNILDVGVDVPAVGAVGICGGYKAEVSLRQRIGRGAREKKFGPNIFFVFDFTDSINNHLRDHARERRMIVDTTPGFAEGVVSEFPFDKLGFPLVR